MGRSSTRNVLEVIFNEFNGHDDIPITKSHIADKNGIDRGTVGRYLNLLYRVNVIKKINGKKGYAKRWQDKEINYCSHCGEKLNK